MRFIDFHPSIKIRILQIFMSRFVSGMIFPFMAIYLAQYMGVKLTGILLLLNILIGIVAGFYGGHYADRRGRKQIMLFAETFRLLAFIMMAFANSPWYHSAWLTFAMMTINSICWGLSAPAGDAMLIDVSTPEQRKLMYSITYWSSNLSIAIGGMLGAFLFKTHLFELFVALVTVTLISVLLIVFYISESFVPSKEKMQEKFSFTRIYKSYKEVWKDRLFILFVLAGALEWSMEQQLTNYIGIHMSQTIQSTPFFIWNLSGIEMLGILRTENTLLVVLISFLAVKLIEPLRDRTVLLSGVFLYVAGYAILSFSTNLWFMLLVMFFLTVGEVSRVPVEQSYRACLPPKHARSSYLAFSSMQFQFAAIIASLTVTLSAFVPHVVVATVITLIGITCWVLFYRIIPGLEKRKMAVIEEDKVG